MNQPFSVEEVLKTGIEREIEAFNLYSGAAKGTNSTPLRKALEEMAELVDDALIQNIFQMLANEEMKHKNRLERMYEDEVYQEF